jgi:hypothetical protein
MGNKKKWILQERFIANSLLYFIFGNSLRGYDYQYDPNNFSIEVKYLGRKIWWGKFMGTSGNPIKDGFSENKIKLKIALQFMNEMRDSFRDKILQDGQTKDNTD